MKRWDKMTSILQRNVPGFIPSRTNISFRVTEFGTKLFYSLLLQKHISLFDNHFIHSPQSLICKGRLPNPKIPNFGHCTDDDGQISPLQLLHHSNWTQIAKHKIQIHRWLVGVVGFTNVHLCMSCQCTKSLCPIPSKYSNCNFGDIFKQVHCAETYKTR